MINPDQLADAVGEHLRDNYLHGAVVGLEQHQVAAAEFPTLIGLLYSYGTGDPRWTFDQWVAALDAWIESRQPIQKGIRPGSAMKAYPPNWLDAAELEAWKFARERAGLRIHGIEDQVRARLRTVMADAIALKKPQAEVAKIVAEKMRAAFDQVQKSWDLVATTEVAAAFNEGVVAAAGNTRYVVLTETGACPKCKAEYHGDNGEPRVFETLAELLPVLPPSLHPRCRCSAKPLGKR